MTEHIQGNPMLGTLVFAGVSSAQEGPPYSIDIELVRPSFGAGGFAGFDLPRSEPGPRFGALLMYEDSPLTLHEALGDQELGDVVASRLQLALGGAFDVRSFTFSATLPIAASWGGEVAGFSVDGLGAGDLSLGARWSRPLGAVAIGARAGATLPTGRPSAWLAERAVRLGGGVVASLELGAVTVATDLGLQARTAVETSEDFLATNELTWAGGARWALPDATRLAVTGEVLARAGLAGFLAGGAENSAELLGGVEIYPTARTTVGVAAGRGLTEGYGTTDFRLLTRVTVAPQLRERPVPAPVITDRPPAPPPFDPEVVRDELPDAVFVHHEIVIREPIEFVVDTATVQPYSTPVLQAIADLINERAEIGHVVIEGHASAEGTVEHNYHLAEARAQAIWEWLLAHGVAEERVSYRAFGEVQPEVAGEDEDALQRNRRVRFRVTVLIPEDGPFPDYPDTQVLPWSGDAVPVRQPPSPLDE